MAQLCYQIYHTFLKMYKFQAKRKNLEETYKINLSQIQSALRYQGHQDIRFKVKCNQELTATCVVSKIFHCLIFTNILV